MVLLDRLSEKGLTVNPKRCVFYQRSVEFFGYVFSNEGISASPNKVRAVKEASSPTNVTEVRSFLGLTNYCARFIPNYATLTAPLRQLTKKYSRCQWTETCQIAFDKIKDALSSKTVMSRVHTTKLAKARPRPGLGSAQVYVVSTLQGKIASVDTNLGRAQDSTQVIARNVGNKDDYLLVRKYWWKRKSLDLGSSHVFC